MLIVAFSTFHLCAQIIPASPANWLYPEGNLEGTRYQQYPSNPQPYDSLIVKWAIPDVYGNIQPLVGNIVSNNPLVPNFPWGPNEFAVVIRDSLLIFGADGKKIAGTALPPQVQNVSVLFDSTALLPSVYTVFPVIMGLSTIEHENVGDSVAYAYIAAYDASSQQLLILKRLTVDLRSYAPNNAASVTPILGRTIGTRIGVYATVNMSNPRIVSQSFVDPPFFRGMTQFNTADFRFPFPRPDVLDSLPGRYTVGPEISVAPPSISIINNRLQLLLPCYPTPTLSLRNPIPNPYTDFTYPDHLYLFHLDLQGNTPAIGSAFTELVDLPSQQRPLIRPYFVYLTDAGAGGVEQPYILLAEEYSGRNGSQGTAALHLYDLNGVPLTFPRPYPNEAEESFTGANNHLWSIAVGNVDGLGNNESLPYYPNNPGKEIVVTQTTRDFSVPNNRLMILRYRTGPRIPKTNVAADSLRYLDTIVTSPMQGWVAAVNDFDSDPSQKEEIFIVAGSTLRILRLRDYADPRFRLGAPFDTLYSITFPNETIFSVAIIDMDGDGYNDILITTSRKTYLIGKKIVGALFVLQPNLPTTLCDGDTVQIRWINYTGGNPSVRILFRHYQNGLPTNTLIPIVDSLPNTSDTMQFLFVYQSDTLSGVGRFLIQSRENPQVLDSTGIITLQPPSITLTSPAEGQRYTVGDTAQLSGIAICLDEVLLQYGYFIGDSLHWFDISTVIPQNDSLFQFSFEIPCLPFFPCDAPIMDSLLSFRAIGAKFLPNRTLLDTSGTITIIVLPDTFSIQIQQPSGTICQERTFQWFNSPKICDTLLFYFSPDRGTTFVLVDTLLWQDGRYTWSLSTTLPDTVLLRLCCIDGCIRADTLLSGLQVTLVKAIAPNPFDPTKAEPLSILYTLPEEATVTIKIFDQSNRLLRTLIEQQHRMPNILYCDQWDGTVHGSIVPNGMYYIVLEFSNNHREVYAVFVAKGY